MESGQELAFMERLAQQPINMSRKNYQKCLAGRKANLKGLKRMLPRNRKNCGIVSGQEDGMRFCRKLFSVTSKLVETNILRSRPHNTFSRSCMMLKEVAQGLCAGEKRSES